jgi:hypothetical protein
MKRAMLFVALSGIAFGADTDSVLTADGLGSVEIGMSLDQLERAVRTKLAYNPYVNRGCSVVTTPQMEPRGLSFTIEQKRLTRINLEFYGNDPRSLATKTDAGIGLGSPEEAVTKAYIGHIRITPNAADPTWRTLYVDKPDHSRGIVFETDGKKVKSIRAGEYPTITSNISCNGLGE